MDRAAAAVVAAFAERRGEILEFAMRAIEQGLDGGSRYTRPEMEQLLRGFEALVVEAAEGQTTETRDFFIETAVPGFIADGQTPASLVRGTTLFAVLLASELTRGLDDALREEATGWLAAFFGSYACKVVEAALDAVRS